MKITYNIQIGIGKEFCDDSALLRDRILNNEKGILQDDALVGKIFIADGVGGNAGGRDASLFVCQKLSDSIFCPDADDMRKQLIKINNELINYANSVSQKENMATTLTGLVFNNEQVYMIHCGNSRIYAFHGGYLEQITSDHTSYQWFMDIGREDLAEVCNKSEIQGAFGGGTDKYIDILIVREVFKKRVPQIILLTTDGIHDFLSIDDLESVISDSSLSSEEKVSKLVNEARLKGSMDDCSVIFVNFL